MARGLRWPSAVICSTLALGAPGCLLSGPPELAEPEQTRPNLSNFSPPLTQIVAATSGTTMPFSANVQSEDAGEDLAVVLVSNYDLPTWDIEYVGVLGPSTLADSQRRVSPLWDVADRPGCHQVTLLVTHLSNYAPEIPMVARDRNDVAIATWWAEVDGDFSNCPTNAGAQP